MTKEEEAFEKALAQDELIEELSRFLNAMKNTEYWIERESEDQAQP